LYRRHKQPPFCKRCGCVCENKDELDAHYISDITCERNEELQAPEGLPTGLLEKLKSRKKIIKHQTEEARWRYIYCLIFPEETKIPSPCEYPKYPSYRKATVMFQPFAQRPSRKLLMHIRFRTIYLFRCRRCNRFKGTPSIQ
jgi:hypothetical protein